MKNKSFKAIVNSLSVIPEYHLLVYRFFLLKTDIITTRIALIKNVDTNSTEKKCIKIILKSVWAREGGKRNVTTRQYVYK